MDQTFGRTKIESAVDVIDARNVIEVVSQAATIFDENVEEIEALYSYYKGNQAILERTKEVRDDINNMIVDNLAKEIVDFKTGYLLQSPMVYVTRNGDEFAEEVQRLNDYMIAEGKAAKDKELVDWMHICGQGYRMALPDQYIDPNEVTDECPFESYVLDPRKAFCIYSSGIDGRKLAGVYRIVNADGDTVYTAYTNESRFEWIDGDESVSTEVNGIGMIPIVEYPANEARLGAFEPVISLLDAINKVDSNRVDGVEQFIQSLILLKNCELPEGTTSSTLMQAGLVQLKSTSDMDADVKILSEQLNQSETQTLKDDLRKTVLEICAMPNRNGGTSTSDTGIAVVYRDGWSAAETAAASTELMIKSSEAEMLKVELGIAFDLNQLALNPSKVDLKFTRRNYENLETKATVLTTLLDNPKVAPIIAYTYCNLFPDPEEACKVSMEYYEANKTELDGGVNGES